jgi:hypothetical protein
MQRTKDGIVGNRKPLASTTKQASVGPRKQPRKEVERFGTFSSRFAEIDFTKVVSSSMTSHHFNWS